nr:MAG TPA: hypothetical protein [Caudoviricetes sp.]
MIASTILTLQLNCTYNSFLYNNLFFLYILFPSVS